MTVEVQFTRRLGNNLFQYALGRIISETLGYELVCQPPPAPTNMPRAEKLWGNYVTLPDMAHHFPSAPLHLAGKRVLLPQERYVAGERNYAGQGVPLRAILENSEDRRIVLRGYFQRTQYYAPYRERIRNWFTPSIDNWTFTPDANDVVLSIRRGADYFQEGWALPTDYYLQALEKTVPGKVYVCGVGIDDEIMRALRPYSPTYYSASAIEEYKFISSFNKIVLSNSTFAWWAAWVSDAEQIVFPRCRSYWGEEFPDIDLEVEQARYTYINDVGTYIWRPLCRNPKVHMSISEPDAEGYVILTIGDGCGSKQHRLPSCDVPALEWILDQTDSFGPVDVLPHFLTDAGGKDAKREVRRLLRVLVDTDVVEADVLCREWLKRSY